MRIAHHKLLNWIAHDGLLNGLFRRFVFYYGIDFKLTLWKPTKEIGYERVHIFCHSFWWITENWHRVGSSVRSLSLYYIIRCFFSIYGSTDAFTISLKELKLIRRKRVFFLNFCFRYCSMGFVLGQTKIAWDRMENLKTGSASHHFCCSLSSRILLWFCLYCRSFSYS